MRHKNVVANMSPCTQARQENSRMRQERARMAKAFNELKKSSPPTSPQDQHQQIKALEKQVQEVRHFT
jgi:hypothetical protein